MESNVVIANLMKNGAKKVSGIVVRSANAVAMESYVRISLNMNKEVDHISVAEDGTQTDDKRNILFTSNFALTSLLRNDEECASVIDVISNSPKVLTMLLAGATIDILQQRVAKGDPYVNPFSSNQNEENAIPFDHDVVINHIISIKLSPRAKGIVSRVVDAEIAKALAETEKEEEVF